MSHVTASSLSCTVEGAEVKEEQQKEEDEEEKVKFVEEEEEVRESRASFPVHT